MPFAVEVLAFGDEEGVRFPVTLTGSRALAGLVQPDALEARDGDEVCLAQALRDFGCDPGRRGAARPRSGLGVSAISRSISSRDGPGGCGASPVGIVTAIAGASRHVVTVEGRAGHAGTVAMTLRRRRPGGGGRDGAGDRGRGERDPRPRRHGGPDRGARGAVNVIPALTRFSLDLRSPSDAVRRRR